MDASSEHLSLAPSAFTNVYFKRSWTSLEVFPLLEGDCNNHIICRALLTGESSAQLRQPLDKEAQAQLCCTYTQTLPVPCQMGSNPASARAENPCHAIPNNWVLHSCPGRGSTRHSCFRRVHWCELSLEPLQLAGTDQQTNRTIHPRCIGCHVPFFPDSLRFQ